MRRSSPDPRAGSSPFADLKGDEPSWISVILWTTMSAGATIGTVTAIAFAFGQHSNAALAIFSAVAFGASGIATVVLILTGRARG